MWNVFSTISGVASLASLADDIIAWKGFLSEAVNFYKSFVYPFFDLFLLWLPVAIPTYIYDYLVIGIITASSHIRTSLVLRNIASISKQKAWINDPIEEILLRSIQKVFIWPIYVIQQVLKLEFTIDEEKILQEQVEFQLQYPELVDDGSGGWKPRSEKYLRAKALQFSKYEIARRREPSVFILWFVSIWFGFLLLIIVNQIFI